MKEYYNFLIENPLLTGFTQNQFYALLQSAGARIKKYGKDEVIMLTGAPVKGLGIVLSGTVIVAKQDIYGNNNILTHIKPQGIFAEVFECAGITRSPVTVTAETACEVLMLNIKDVLFSFPQPDFRDRITENLLMVISRKNLALSDKVACIGQRSIREKVIAFLSLLSEKADSRTFKIPYTRYQMADYLCVDRSALSYVLSDMKKQGIIDYNKNTFRLL